MSEKGTQMAGGGDTGDGGIMDGRLSHFIQTDRDTHEKWALFSVKKPSASTVLHYLVSQMKQNSAVMVSQAVIAEKLGISDRTVQRAIKDLEAGFWIQVVRVGTGRECVYVLNDRVAWTQGREKRRFAHFSADIVADVNEQSDLTLSQKALNRIPVMFDTERQLPSGEGLPPESQRFLDGMEPDLPARRMGRSPMDDARDQLDNWTIEQLKSRSIEQGE